MFQESEIINLILAIVAVFIVVSPVQKIRVQGFQLFYVGFFLIVAALIFTVVEGIFWKPIMNFFEHACYALASLSFGMGCWRNRRGTQTYPGKELPWT